MEKIQQYVEEEMRQFSRDLRVCMPARIETYDADTHTASVQPLILRKFYGQVEAKRMPIIPKVPVIHPRTAGALIRLPVTAGDIVTLVFADHSLDRWLMGDGTEKDPGDLRAHHITDAYALLGGYPRGAPFPAANPNALEIVVSSGTKVSIGNGTDEVLNIAHDAFAELKSLCQQVSSALTAASLLTVTGVTGGGGVSGVPVNAAAFVAIKASVDSIATQVNATMVKLDNLKV